MSKFYFVFKTKYIFAYFLWCWFEKNLGGILMEIRKILEKELSKSGGQAELVKVPPERRPSKESLDRLNRDVEGLVRMTGNQVAK